MKIILFVKREEEFQYKPKHGDAFLQCQWLNLNSSEIGEWTVQNFTKRSVGEGQKMLIFRWEFLGEMMYVNKVTIYASRTN